MDKAKSQGGFERALALFAESGDSDFVLRPHLDSGASIELPRKADGQPRCCAASDLFVPPSTLKREKNRIYAEAAELVRKAEATYALESISISSIDYKVTHDRPASLPPRAALVFPRPDLPSGMPFAMPRDLAAGTPLPMWEGRAWLPLAPLALDRDRYAALVFERVRAELTRGASLVLGLGALHHFAMAREMLAADPAAKERLVFFIDINLYVANDRTYASLASLLPRVEFAYRYIEPGGSASEKGEGRGIIVPVGTGFEPPLFQSLGCLLKHHVSGGSCPADCPRYWSATLSDRDRRYRAIVEDCVTMLFRITETGKD
jgi:hypothetical protein